MKLYLSDAHSGGKTRRHTEAIFKGERHLALVCEHNTHARLITECCVLKLVHKQKKFQSCEEEANYIVTNRPT